MKKLLVLLMALFTLAQVDAQEKNVIRIATDNTDLILQVAPNGRLYQAYLGDKLLNEKDINNFSPYVKGGSDGSVSTRGWEVYPGSGAEDYFEPAVAITHNDGNPSTILRYVSSEQKAVAGGTETVIQLKDDQYPVEVTLHYIAYPKENVIKTWSEIKHAEKKPVTLWRYASTMLYFSGNEYYLTEFSSDWAKEAQMSTQPLLFGKKVIDTKLGSRAAMHTHPFFELGFEQPAQEAQGRAMLGTIGWTGNFQFTFEVDNVGNLRVIPAINPYASDYELKPNEVFTTPEFIFTFSNNGTGEASRNLHAWARNYQLKDGQGDRMTLLNNWENTYFKFNEELLAELMKEAKHLGVDMFLLDDGWFGNKHPRNSDNAGLGDWEVMRSKLPGGIPALVQSAKEAGVKFGIWIEPEMVNPKSELFEKHPDWAIQLPNRETYYYRNQLVLDLSNPKVQDFVYGVVDKILTENPEVAFFKWDCNSPITNVYSPYLKNKQVIVTLADSTINSKSDLANKKVGAQSESSAVTAMEKEEDLYSSFNGGGAITFEDNNQALMDLEAGRIDVVVADEILVRYYLSLKGEDKFKILDDNFGEEEYGVGIRKGDTEMVDAFNNAYTEMQLDGTLKKISEKWFNEDITIKVE